MADIDSKTLEQVIMGALDGYSNASAGGQQQSAVNKAVIKWLKNNPNFQEAITRASKNSQKDSKKLKDATDKITAAVKDEAKVTRKELEKIGQDSDNNWSKFASFMENKWVKGLIKAVSAAGVVITKGVLEGQKIAQHQRDIYNSTGMGVGYDNLLSSIKGAYISLGDLSNLISKNSDAFRVLTKNLGNTNKATSTLAQAHKAYIKSMESSNFYRSSQEASEDLAEFLESQRKFGIIQNLKSQDSIQSGAEKFNKTLLTMQEAFGVNKKDLANPDALVDAAKTKARLSGIDPSKINALFAVLDKAGVDKSIQGDILSGKFQSNIGKAIANTNPDLANELRALLENPEKLNGMDEKELTKYTTNVVNRMGNSVDSYLKQFTNGDTGAQQLQAVDYLRDLSAFSNRTASFRMGITEPQSKEGMQSVQADNAFNNALQEAKNELERATIPSMQTFTTELNIATTALNNASVVLGKLGDAKSSSGIWGDVISGAVQGAVAYGGMALLGKGVKGIISKILGETATKAAGKAAVKTGAKAAVKTGAKAATKGTGKSLLKKIPGVGLLAGLGFGAMRAFNGDWKGALGEVASGAASTIPGVGTAASMAIDAGLAIRDAKNAVEAEKQKLEESNTSTEEINASKKTSENMEVIDYSNILNSINNNITTLNNTIKNLPKNSVTY